MIYIDSRESGISVKSNYGKRSKRSSKGRRKESEEEGQKLRIIHIMWFFQKNWNNYGKVLCPRPSRA